MKLFTKEQQQSHENAKSVILVKENLKMIM